MSVKKVRMRYIFALMRCNMFLTVIAVQSLQGDDDALQKEQDGHGVVSKLVCL